MGDADLYCTHCAPTVHPLRTHSAAGAYPAGRAFSFNNPKKAPATHCCPP